MRVGRVNAACSPAGQVPPGRQTEPDGARLTEAQARAEAHGICFKTGPPSRVGVELEWLVRDARDPALAVGWQRLARMGACLARPGALPGGGRLTIEPGGQLELSSAPGAGLGECLARAHADLGVLRRAARDEGLTLTGLGLDSGRPPRRVLDLPRYAAMEEFFDRSGPWGRIMMCSTASVQVCLDAGQDGDGPAGFAWRWRLLHAIGPVMVAAFANSPLRRGRPTGWKSTRQAIWARLDPTRTRSPAAAEPGPGAGQADPRTAWADYALAANVLCVRRPGLASWSAPPGLTFRDWLRGGGDRAPTHSDLVYHLSTLFPPVRPRGHLEFRSIDAQSGDSWVVPVAVLAALVDDPAAAQEAMAAGEALWHSAARDDGAEAGASLWLRAARDGPGHPGLRAAGRRCFAAADAALNRLGAPGPVRRAVAAFTDRYTERGRCPADDRLDEVRTATGRCPPGGDHPDTPVEDWP